jgi:predicted MFS family arabinose efflux permease
MFTARLSRFFAKAPTQVLSLIAVSVLAHVTMSGGRVAASLFALRHGGSEAMAGIAYSLYGLLPALLSLHMGRWIDRVGPRLVMRLSLIAMISGLVLPVFWLNLPVILLTATLGGFGFGSYMLAANVCVSYMDFEHESERVGMIGWLQLGNSVSSVVGPSLVGMLIDFSGFRAAFGGLALIVLCSFLTSYRVQLPDGKRERARAQRSDASVVRMVFSSPHLLRIYLLAMTVSMAWDGFNFMVPVLGQARGYSATVIGMVLSAFAIGTFAIRAALPWLSRRMAEWRQLSLAFALTASVFFLLPLARSSVLLAALGFIFGLAAGAGQPNILSLIYRAMPDGKAGEGAGLRSMMGNLMGLTGPSVYGAVSTLFGAVPVFLIIACVMSVSSWQAQRGERHSLQAG